jgi:hypothetical protein
VCEVLSAQIVQPADFLGVEPGDQCRQRQPRVGRRSALPAAQSADRNVKPARQRELVDLKALAGHSD